MSNKLCPILKTDCQKNNCEWWSNNQCAIKSLPDDINGLHDDLDNILKALDKK